MPVILWSILVLVVALAVVVVATSRARRRLPPLELLPGEHLPATPLQQLAGLSTALGIVLGAGAFAVVAWAGPATYQDDDVIRLSATGLLIGSLAALAAAPMIAGLWMARGSARLDERDRAILAASPAGQAGAMMVVLAAWMIGLQEAYRGAPGIPGSYLTLIFWSCVLTALLASNVGVLLGYRRS